MSLLPTSVSIIEVGPRDGLQNEATRVAAATKVELVDRLSATGLRTIETTSFVSPVAVPQMADAATVLTGITRRSGIMYPVLVPNERGYDDALEAGATSVAVPTSASETFSQRNVRASIDTTIARIARIAERAADDGVHVRGYVSTAFGCPFEGPIPTSAVTGVVARLLDLGIIDISIGDTIGVAVPGEIGPMTDAVREAGAVGQLALHLHDTRGTALANAWAGLHAGVDTFDTSIAGLGGCPFAPGATGNLATEDLVWMCNRSGIETGVDVDGLIDTARWISTLMDRTPAGHIASTRVWPWAAAEAVDRPPDGGSP